MEAELVTADALRWDPGRTFDAILLDAPCSATGTFRRHPEVLYRARPSIVAETSALQARLIARAASWLKPGGVLVYSVCSLEPAEGEKVTATSGLRVDKPETAELPGFAAPSPEGWVRIVPGVLEAEGGLDGFFTARLVRGN